MLITMKDICRETGFTSAGIYQMIRRGTFVPPIKWGRLSKWRDDDVQRIIDARSQNKTDDEIKALVAQLSQRQASSNAASASAA